VYLNDWKCGAHSDASESRHDPNIINDSIYIKL
jgi:hypothetical protein